MSDLPRRVNQQELALEWDPAVGAGRHAAGSVGQGPPLSEDLCAAWAQRSRELASAVAGGVRGLGPIQALLVRCLGTSTAPEEGEWKEEDGELREELFVRVETPHGGLLESWGSPQARATPADQVAREVGGRLAEAEAVLRAGGVALDPTLPLCLSPSAATPIIAALGMLLRGDVALSSGLTRNLGKRVLAPAVTLKDRGTHPAGTRARRVDDEGAICAELTLVEGGRLTGFLHSRGTAAAAGVTQAGRGFRAEGRDAGPAPLNLSLEPSATALPGDHAWLGCRIETFTPSPALGTVVLRLAGREIRAGQAAAPIAPFEVELSVLEVLRRVVGTGPQAVFFPAFDGVGTPWLLLEPGAFQPRLKR